MTATGDSGCAFVRLLMVTAKLAVGCGAGAGTGGAALLLLLLQACNARTDVTAATYIQDLLGEILMLLS